jgi:hypothetical protein
MMSENWKYLSRQLGIVALVLIVAFIIFCLGLVIGYGVIGNVDNPWSILSPNTWKELISKFTGQ